MINKKRFAKLRHGSKWTLSLSLFLLTTMAFADHPAATPADLPTAMVMAAGRSFIPQQTEALPFIASSINGGKTWEIRPITNLPASLYSSQNLISSCTGKGNDAVCVAAGRDVFRSINAFIILSQDGTKTWNYIDLTDQLKDKDGFINGAASIGSGKTATIILTGEESRDHSSPLILISTDGGTHWISKGSSLGVQTMLGTVSCTGEGKTALCMAISSNYTKSLDPLLAISTDGGNTWTSQRVSPSLTEITDINCINGNTCAALGYIKEPTSFIQSSVIKTTTDKGKNWKDSVITDGELNSINCIGSGSSTLCAAVGILLPPPYSAFVTVSTDNGATWVSKPIKDNLPYSRLTNISCTQTKGSAVCVAVGYSIYDGSLIVISPDGGNTWQRVESFEIGRYDLHSVNCSPNGTGAYCAASASTIGERPILVISSDLLNWKILEYTEGPIPLPAYGEFISIASTTSLALPRRKWSWKDKGEPNHDK